MFKLVWMVDGAEVYGNTVSALFKSLTKECAMAIQPIMGRLNIEYKSEYSRVSHELQYDTPYTHYPPPYPLVRHSNPPTPVVWQSNK